MTERWPIYKETRLRDMVSSGATYGQVARELGYSYTSVKSKAYKLGLKSNAKNYWTVGEDIILKRYYPNLLISISQVIRKVNEVSEVKRSLSSVKGRAHFLGLRREEVHIPVKDRIVSDEYIVGFFDGEGCVSTSLRHSSWALLITFSNTDFKVLSAIKKSLGLSRKEVYSLHDKRKGRQICYGFTIAHPIIIRSFIQKVLSRSIVKKEQLELALQFINMAVPTNSKFGRKYTSLSLVSLRNKSAKARNILRKIKKLKNQEFRSDYRRELLLKKVS